MNFEAVEPAWPVVSASDFQSTTDTLHLCSQVAGNVRLMMTPRLSHSCGPRKDGPGRTSG
jgi:hypothetical protein